MTAVLFTTDTELSFMLHRRGLDPIENFRIAIMGEVADGAWGIGHQMARLSAHGLKGVFFVEALSSYGFGIDVLKRTVAAILEAGHEVQLHLHTEWLRWIEKDLVGDRRGLSIANFTEADQRTLLEAGLDAIVAAGAPRPIAFRAGGYGANNDTLKALTSLGVAYDSSYNLPFIPEACHIVTDTPLQRPVRLDGLVEVPITHFADYPNHERSLQLCAASLSEFNTVLHQSIAQRRPTTVIVNHGFELLNTKRTRANRMLLRRFDGYCALMQEMKGETCSAGFCDLKDTIVEETQPAPKALTSNPVRTAFRMIEQTVGTYLYDRA